MKKSVKWIIAVLLLLTVALAAVHLTTRTPDTEGAVLVNGQAVEISGLELSPVTGTVINGKGGEKQIDAQGILLSKLIGSEFSSATVTASDEYSAVVEKQDSDNAYLIVTDDGSLRLVVFGDENSKRDVKNVSKIDYT